MDGEKKVDLPLPKVPGIIESIPRNDKDLELQPDTLPLDIVTGDASDGKPWKDLSVEERAKINMNRFSTQLSTTDMGTATREVTPVDQRIVQLNEARKKQSRTS